MNKRRFWTAEGYSLVITLILLGLAVYTLWPKLPLNHSSISLAPDSSNFEQHIVQGDKG